MISPKEFENSRKVPIGGELWNYPFRGVIAEDYVSTRWFEKRFAELTGEAIHGVKGMIDLYQAGKYKTETEQVFLRSPAYRH